jgi:cell division protein FtsX
MVAIVDASLARAAWPGQSAIGRKIDAVHVTEDGFTPVSSVVVGVVEHTYIHSLTKEVRRQIYTPFNQNRREGLPASFVVRASVPPLSLLPAIRERLRQQGRRLYLSKVRLMTEYVDREIAPHRFTAVLATIFGGLALVLAATGIYGVFNYQISQRRREMGIRMAMGATVGDLLSLVLREGVAVTAFGVLLGAAATLAATRWLGTLIYGLSAYDPLSYGLALLLLPAAALLGCWRPARLAATANPAETIRQE